MPIIAKLEVLLDDTGKVTVNGPIDNRLLCFGLLEVAKVSIQDFSLQAKGERSLELSPQDRAEISRLALKP